MLSLFRQFSAWPCGVLLAACYTQACAEPDLDVHADYNARTSYDEVTAIVPRQQAEIPSVALAKINISLYRAKQLVEGQLCAGNWTPRGTLLYRQDSQAADAWLFQTLRSPEALACPNVTRAEYFMEMSRHLPSWISVRPAGQMTTFRLGQAYTNGQHSLATR